MKNIRRLNWASIGLIILTLLILAFGCGQNSASVSSITPTDTLTPTPSSSIITSTKIDIKPEDNMINVSGLMMRLSISDLVGKSDAIVTGKVAQIMPSQKSEDIIYTDVIIHTERYLYGNPQSESIAVRVQGGRIGNTVMIVEDAPVFNLGEEVILFLRKFLLTGAPPTGIEQADYYTVYGLWQGKYPYSDSNITDIEQKIAILR